MDMPDHDLQPPRFCRTALEQLLDDWLATKAMIMSGTAESNGSEEQSGTALLDKFTYRMLVKCSPGVSQLPIRNYAICNNEKVLQVFK